MRRLRDRLRKYGEEFEQRQAARASIPAWAATAKLLIVAASILSVCGTLLYAGFALHELLHPGTLGRHMPGPAPALIVIAAIFAGIPLALMLSNVLVWVVPPLRDIENKAFAKVPNATFADGMRQLSYVAALTVPICLIAAAMGIIDPWI
ncbi:MAG: hypothetical protein GC190_15945 [Alphaproteobacteria bacterium]|nr:hypothetical protein [Alphaproteobacteria bacterium]